tara:strand:+ start:413 stop:949 length:537 start_codon:yes stop_codon:yes gene_type:complete
MPRLKSSSLSFDTPAAFERAVDTLAIKQLKLEKTIATYNAEKQTADKAHKALVNKLRAELNEIVVNCEAYAIENRDELLGNRQTASTKLAQFGFRKIPGVIKTLNRKFTFASCLELLIKGGKDACVKTVQALDKNAVKREIPEADLPQYGLRMEHNEDFWVEAIRTTDTPAKRLGPSA